MPGGRTKLVEILVRLRDEASKGLKKLNKELGSTGPKVNIAERALGRFRTGIQDIRSAMFGLTGALAALGIGLTAKSFLDAATESENYQVRLTALLGSVEEGNRLFKEMADFAGQVPFAYNEVMGAATALSGVMKGGVDEITKWMPMIADLAAVSGLDIQTTTQQIIRMYSAGAASADLFRERGITAMLGFKAGVSYSAEATKKQLIKAWEDPASKFKDATKSMAKTWDGVMSMIGDKWFQFRNMIMDAGVFEALKNALSDINERFGVWIEQNRTLIGVKVPEYVDKIKNIFIDFFSIAKEIDKKTLGLGLVAWAMYGKAGGIAVLLALGYTSKKIKELRKELDETGKVKLKTGPNLIERLFGRYDDADTIRGRIEKLKNKIEELKNASDFELKNEYFLQDPEPTIKKYEKQLKVLEDHLQSLVAPKNVVEIDAEVDATDVYKFESDYDAFKVKVEDPIPLKIQVQTQLTDLKYNTKQFLSELDYQYSQGSIRADQYYEERKQKLEDSTTAEIGLLGKLLEEAGKEPKKRAPILAKIKSARRKLTTDLTILERKRARDAADLVKKEIDARIELIENLSDLEIENLDYLYEQKAGKDAEYYRKRREIITSEIKNEIDLLKEKKAAEPSIKEQGAIEIQIAEKKVVLQKKLLGLYREEVGSRKEIYEKMMSDRGQMLSGFTKSVEDFKQVENEWLAFKTAQLAKDYSEYLKVAENKEIAEKWLKLRQKELLDEYLQNSSLAYQMLTTMSQRTAEAIEQAFSDYLFNAMQGKFDSWRDALYNLFSSLQRMTADVLGGLLKQWLVNKMKMLIAGTKDAAQAGLKIKQLTTEAAMTKALMGAQAAQIGVVNALAAAYAYLAAMKMLAGAGGGSAGAGAGAGGGSVVGGVDVGIPFAEGGAIPGISPTPIADNIPIMATAGEFMQPVKAVQYYGKQAMEKIRTMSIPKEIFSNIGLSRISFPTPRLAYAEGGEIGGHLGSSITRDTQSDTSRLSPMGGGGKGQALNIINVFDPSEFEGYLASPEGQDAIINVMSQRQDTIRKLVR